MAYMYIKNGGEILELICM